MARIETALFGLGCFWNSEEAFIALPGVKSVVVGYAGGTTDHPTYHDRGDHAEVVRIDFNPHEVHYEDLLKTFWEAHDPTLLYEPHYRSIILYADDAQKRSALDSKRLTQHQHDQPIVTEIHPLQKFYKAETYHQHYLAKLRGELAG